MRILNAAASKQTPGGCAEAAGPTWKVCLDYLWRMKYNLQGSALSLHGLVLHTALPMSHLKAGVYHTLASSALTPPPASLQNNLSVGRLTEMLRCPSARWLQGASELYWCVLIWKPGQLQISKLSSLGERKNDQMFTSGSPLVLHRATSTWVKLPPGPHGRNSHQQEGGIWNVSFHEITVNLKQNKPLKA